jgi:hypothetical protein
MVRVHHRAEVFRLELPCKICDRRCTIDQLWLAFPPNGDVSIGYWIHRTCLDAEVRRVFGTRRVTLLQGRVALERLIESLTNEVMSRD